MDFLRFGGTKISFNLKINFRIAILPLLNHSFQWNDTSGLRGFYRLQERHLHILGYNVIQICYREWNSMTMTLPGAREHFLSNFLKKYSSITN